jgi:hypothetical protein
MKKLLTVAVAALLIMGLAAATYAMEMKASGFIRVRTAWYEGTGDPGAPRATADNYEDTEAWTDSRFRLKLDFIASEDLMGVIYFEGDSTKWGEASGTRNAAGFYTTDRAAVELKQFYIDFKVPGISEFAPNRLRVGTQWMAIRSHVCLGADAAAARWQVDTGPVRHYFNWIKPWEGTDYQYDDTDMYAYRIILSLPDFPVRPGAFVLYMNSNDFDYFGFPGGRGWGGGSGLLRPGITDSLGDGEFYWIGVNVDGKVGPVALKTDFVYFGGEAEPSSTQKALSGNFIQDADYGGWCIYADANANLDFAPGLNVGGTFLYATGNDLDEHFQSKPDFEAYYMPPGEGNPSLGTVFWAGKVNDAINMARVSQGLDNRSDANSIQQRYIGGLWTIKGYASIKPLDWLKLTGYGMYIGDTVDNGNAVGDAWAWTFSTYEDESDIGIEFGAIADMSVYKNLTYSVAVGYLFAGGALDTWTGTPGINDEPGDPWAIVSQLMYKF